MGQCKLLRMEKTFGDGGALSSEQLIRKGNPFLRRGSLFKLWEAIEDGGIHFGVSYAFPAQEQDSPSAIRWNATWISQFIRRKSRSRTELQCGSLKLVWKQRGVRMWADKRNVGLHKWWMPSAESTPCFYPIPTSSHGLIWVQFFPEGLKRDVNRDCVRVFQNILGIFHRLLQSASWAANLMFYFSTYLRQIIFLQQFWARFDDFRATSNNQATSVVIDSYDWWNSTELFIGNSTRMD